VSEAQRTTNHERTGGPTVHDLVLTARQRLRAAGIPPEEADLDARLLAEHVLEWTTERFFADSSEAPPPAFDARFDALVARRAAREPFAYIVGHQEFWGLHIDVSPAVLIPRPETELIVEAACEIIAADSPATVADVGTGSGCLAVAIARERSRATIVATDVSDAALDIARRNAEKFNVASRITLHRTDLLDAVDDMFDLVVSNPPYVREGDRSDIQPEVRFEPAGALYAGDDGLDVMRRLVPQSVQWLKGGGTLIFEFGFGQADAVSALISSAAGLKMVALRRDLQGIPRVAIAQRN
jgi:release factor glutamine methyltransferase